MRANSKKTVTNYENAIKKSNAFSMAKLSYGLSLNQMQLLAYAIFATQQNGRTEFHKSNFEKKFNIVYRTERAREDVRKLFDLSFSTEDLENEFFDFQRVFERITYKRGLLTFKWTEDIKPHILELKTNHTTIDLTITAKFKSSFSWTLYDFVKSYYGRPVTYPSS